VAEAIMALNRFTPVPPISSAADNSEELDAELKEEMDEWRRRISTLDDTDNFESEVSYHPVDL